jgi:hypothetical protein
VNIAAVIWSYLANANLVLLSERATVSLQSRVRARESKDMRERTIHYFAFGGRRRHETRRPRCAGCEAEARAASQARAAAASPSEIGRRTLLLQQSIHQERKEAKYMYILHVAGSHAWSRAEPPQLKTLK